MLYLKGQILQYAEVKMLLTAHASHSLLNGMAEATVQSGGQTSPS